MNTIEPYVEATEAAIVARACGVALPSNIVELAKTDFIAFEHIIQNEWAKTEKSRSKNASGRGLAIRNLRRAVIEWQRAERAAA